MTRKPQKKYQKTKGPENHSPGEKSNQTIIYGRNTVLSYLENELKSNSNTINKVYVFANAGSDSRLLKIQNLAKKLKIQVHQATKEKIESILNNEDNPNHQGVIASLSPVELLSIEELLDSIEDEKTRRLDAGISLDGLTIVVADGVIDPRNLGAIIRTAESEGAFAVIVPERRAASVTDIVAKTSAGALAHIPIVRVTNIAKSLEKLKNSGFWVLGMSPEAKQPIYRIDLKAPIVLIVGSEGKGMGRLVTEKCDFLGSIPTLGKTESLNVSVALGIGLFEIVRQNDLDS